MKGEKPLHCSRILYEYRFWSCFACRWIFFAEELVAALESRCCITGVAESWVMEGVATLGLEGLGKPSACCSDALRPVCCPGSMLELGLSCAQVAFHRALHSVLFPSRSSNSSQHVRSTFVYCNTPGWQTVTKLWYTLDARPTWFLNVLVVWKVCCLFKTSM